MRINITLSTQTLTLLNDAGQNIAQYTISSGAAGIGQQMGSYKTPLGKHRIAEKIGADLPVNAVMVGRRWTGEVYHDALGQAVPDRDWILTRILWLEGLEPGFNQGGEVDTKNRYVYIHGTPDSTRLGMPGSKGCIRMRNDDLLALFEAVTVGTPVDIIE
ncbi:MAG: L,D-transpeptidase [Gammaproteobacteria bacterium CG11_big_fil_rev_8_21_14_0_20_46_22]|nr:MAG: L,D-transpeptidase [Gammaproteobacteria bacterium CG12_big_fil_rev_8_21_14_0_65_46_12]PIR11745.1 MAG: L,D-transpeptidase [Gammaproteobacteria bacterium CG11_big_fil_rev_8_21_14_0_20_46_22]